MNPYETLLAHEDVINIMVNDGYVPGHGEASFGEIRQAVKIITGLEQSTCCAESMFNTARDAKRHLDAYKNNPATFHKI